MDAELSRLVKGVSDIASLPAIYIRLNKVINHPYSSINDIGNVVSQDPGLTARLLRLVNSAFYGFHDKIETVSHAISLIGTRQLQDIALATSVIELFRDVPAEFVNMDSFWKHSLYCGLTARSLAAKKRESNVERFFVGGLLHDIGRVIIYNHYAEIARKIFERYQNENHPLVNIEEFELGFSHASVGWAISQKWGLPTSLQEAILFHHQPSQARKFPLLTAIIHLADIITNARQIGSSGESAIPRFDTEIWDILQLPSNFLEELIDDTDRQFKVTLEIILR